MSPFQLPGTGHARADALWINDRIIVRHHDEDLWAPVTAIKPAADAGKLRLEPQLEAGGEPVGRCAHTPKPDRVYLRKLPHGRSRWDRNGTVSVNETRTCDAEPTSISRLGAPTCGRHRPSSMCVF